MNVKELLINYYKKANRKSTIEIVCDFLKSEKYEGLRGVACSCKCDDLAPLIDCGDNILECRPEVTEK